MEKINRAYVRRHIRIQMHYTAYDVDSFLTLLKKVFLTSTNFTIFNVNSNFSK